MGTGFSFLAIATAYLSSTGASTLASIIASAYWVVGSVLIPGNIFLLPDSNTTTTNRIFVGIQETLNITSSGLNFVTNGSQSGVTLKDGGTTAIATKTITCIGSGGNVKVNNGAKYDTCISRLPLSSSGVLTAVSLEWAGAPVASVGYDCGIVKGTDSGTGTVLLNNMASASGSTSYVTSTSFSGSLVPKGIINGADYFKCGTLTDPGPGLSMKVKLWYYDTTAE